MTFGGIYGKTKFWSFIAIFFAVFGPAKDANFGHWTLRNDFWWHLKQTHFFLILPFLTPKMGIFYFPNMQILVMGDPK